MGCIVFVCNYNIAHSVYRRSVGRQDGIEEEDGIIIIIITLSVSTMYVIFDMIGVDWRIWNVRCKVSSGTRFVCDISDIENVENF